MCQILILKVLSHCGRQCLSTRVNARQRVLHIYKPTNQSVLSKFQGHFDWLAHEYAIRVDAR